MINSLGNEQIYNKKYPIITLCGSTKFKNEFLQAQKNLTLQGYIVLSVGLFGHSGDNEAWDNKQMLDDMHKHKIDISDAIMVIDKNNYIGPSTQNEIEYAKSKGKFIYFYNNPAAYYDNLGGFHDSGMGWNPNGNWCGECTMFSCKNCPNKEFIEKENIL